MKMNQRQRILSYIDDFGSITPMQAFSDLGITKLATRISELIREGIEIEKVEEHGVNRYGEKTRYMKYRRKGTDDRLSAGLHKAS